MLFYGKRMRENRPGSGMNAKTSRGNYCDQSGTDSDY